MGTQERREREKKALREEILDAARDLFVEQGYESVSMRKIADRIEYSPTAIYLHFKDKSELLTSICDETFAKLSAALEGITQHVRAGKRDPVELLKKGLHAYVDFGLAHPNHYQLTFLTASDGPPEKESTGLQAFGHLATSVEACVRTGALQAGDVQEMSQALWAGVHGVTALLIQHPCFPFVARKKLIRRVVDSMVEGMRKA